MELIKSWKTKMKLGTSNRKSQISIDSISGPIISPAPQPDISKIANVDSTGISRTSFRKPDFSSIRGCEKCTWVHTSHGYDKYYLAVDREQRASWGVSTEHLAASSRSGCPLCTMLWEAFKSRCRVVQSSPTDFVSLRFSGEDLHCQIKFVLGTSSGDVSGTGLESGAARYADVEISIPWEFRNWSQARAFKCRHQFPSAGTESFTTLSRIIAWQDECSAGHKGCWPTTETPLLPRRVIDVFPILRSGGDEQVKLVETTGESAPYLALSHCWGRLENPFLTTKSTLAQHKAGMTVNSLPKTFRDAIGYTRRLGHRYIWIDSLCIIQDDDEDWKIEASQMASIYRNSTLTLAALHARGDDEGFFSSSSDLAVVCSENLPFPIYCGSSPSSFRYECGHQLELGVQRDRTPLLERGWTFQERLLSPRVVFFGKHEVAWECMTGFACECTPEITQYPTYIEGFTANTPLKASLRASKIDETLWHKIVEDYSALQLTYGKDIFPALAGLITELERLKPRDSYFAGLWEHRFVEDMCWTVKLETSARLHSASDTVLAGSAPRYLSPTWSWASAAGAVKYCDRLHWVTNRSELVDIVCVPVSEANRKGELQSARVVLRGHLTRCILETKPRGDSNEDVEPYLRPERMRQTTFLEQWHDKLTFSPDYVPWQGSRFGRPELKPGARLFYLRLWLKPTYRFLRAIYLVLTLADEAEGTFERVGLLEYRSRREQKTGTSNPWVYGESGKTNRNMQEPEPDRWLLLEGGMQLVTIV